MVVDREWFSDKNLIDSATFPPEPTKCSKLRINKKSSPHGTKLYICTITINSSCNTHFVQIFHEEHDEILVSMKIY